MDSIAGRRKERVLCDLYAKLIGFILFRFLISPVRAEHIDLNLMKAFKRLAKKSANLTQASWPARASAKAVKALYAKLLKWAKQDKQKKRLSTFQSL